MKYYVAFMLVIIIFGGIHAEEYDCIHNEFVGMDVILKAAIEKVETNNGRLSNDAINDHSFQQRCSLFKDPGTAYKCTLIKDKSIAIDPEPMLVDVESQGNYGACYMGAALTNFKYNIDPEKDYSFSDAMCVGNKDRYENGGFGISSLLMIAKAGKILECNNQKTTHKHAVFEINDKRDKLEFNDESISYKEIEKIEKDKYKEIKKRHNKCKKTKLPFFTITEISFEKDSEVLDKISNILRNKKMVLVAIPGHEFNIFGINYYECKNKNEAFIVPTIKILDPNKKKIEVVANDIIKGISEQHELFFLKKEDKKIDIKNIYPGQQGLVYAAATRDISLLKSYLEKPFFKIDIQLHDGSTALFMAANNGDAKMVKILLGKNADPNLARTRDEVTPLFLAAKNGHRDVVELLLKAPIEIKINKKTKEGVSPISISHQNRHFDITQLLANAPGIIKDYLDAPSPKKSLP